MSKRFISNLEVVAHRCSVKKVFLEVLQNSQGNVCARVSFLIKLQAPITLLKKRLWHRCFPVNFTKFLRTTFFTEHLWWLLLHITDQLVIYYMHLKYMKDLYSNKYISILEEFFQKRYHTSYNRKNESGLR